MLPIICVAIFHVQFFIYLVRHFQSHQCQPTTGSFQNYQHLEVIIIIIIRLIQTTLITKEHANILKNKNTHRQKIKINI